MQKATHARPRRSVFRELLISMLLFRTAIGVVLPPFTAVVLGIPEALAFRFFAICMGAGIAVGVANYFLFRFFVSRHMTGVVVGMRHINETVAVALQRTRDPAPRQTACSRLGVTISSATWLKHSTA